MIKKILKKMFFFLYKDDIAALTADRDEWERRFQQLAKDYGTLKGVNNG